MHAGSTRWLVTSQTGKGSGSPQTPKKSSWQPRKTFYIPKHRNSSNHVPKPTMNFLHGLMIWVSKAREPDLLSLSVLDINGWSPKGKHGPWGWLWLGLWRWTLFLLFIMPSNYLFLVFVKARSNVSQWLGLIKLPNPTLDYETLWYSDVSMVMYSDALSNLIPLGTVIFYSVIHLASLFLQLWKLFVS